VAGGQGLVRLLRRPLREGGGEDSGGSQPAAADAELVAAYAWYKRNGLLLKGPKAGSIGMLRGASTGHRHTLLVHAVGDGLVVTVEGNYRNRVMWNRCPAEGCDFGQIC
jgi:hypothetical protein